MNLNYVGIQYHLVIETNVSQDSLHTNNPNINTMSQSSSLEAEFAEKIAKAAAKAAIETAVSELVSRKKKHTGKRLRKNNQISIAHKHLNDCGIEITKHALQHRVQRAFAQATASIPVVNVVHSPSSAISSLTAPTANNEQYKDKDSSEEDDESLVLPDPPKAAGRPKGTTKEKKRQDIVSKKLCTDAFVAVMVKESNDRKAEGNKVAKGFWTA